MTVSNAVCAGTLMTTPEGKRISVCASDEDSVMWIGANAAGVSPMLCFSVDGALFSDGLADP